MNFLIVLMVVAIIIGCFVFLCFFIVKTSWFNDSHFSDPNNEIFLSFREFIDFYKLNPDRYRIEYDYDGDLSSVNVININRYGTPHRLYKIKFKLFSFIRFYYWSKNNKKLEKQRDDNEKMRGFLEIVQKDINSIRERAENEVREAERVTNEVGGRL